MTVSRVLEALHSYLKHHFIHEILSYRHSDICYCCGLLSIFDMKELTWI